MPDVVLDLLIQIVEILISRTREVKWFENLIL